ncbi:MAG: LysR family transcriptional regulator [Selenomonas sp.]|uniref:LysR family transcriptional regulator n=1 Tax=Selenomonas sp. TaxID=2053611 RepID=UPI0025E7D92C|nr:LysR family transcriptional regulator [Selenomonas sp.]MCR5757974.1 LysR family transcriptional regulator [Selenomonas sp.]
MDIEQIKYFLAVYDCKQMTLAAESLFISQSSLSKHIGQLEKEVGVSLFDRSGRTLHVTSAGMDFEVFAREAVAKHDAIIRRLQNGLDGQKCSLTIGTIPILAQYDIHKKILAFHQENPQIQLNFIEEKGDYVLKLLDDGLVDLAIVRTELLDGESYKAIELAQDELVLVLSTRHRLARIENVDLGDLTAEDFFLLDVGDSPRHAVRQACKRAGFTPRIRQAFTRIETIVGFVAANAGVALLMEKDLRAFNLQGVCLKRLNRPLRSIVALTFPHGRHLSTEACRFRDFVADR